MKKMLFILFSFSYSIYGQTLGLLQLEENVEDGYFLYSPYKGDTAYLLDRCGRKVHIWPFSGSAGSFPYLQNDGSIIRATKIPSPEFADGNIGGLIEKIDWDGNIVWNFQYSDDTVCQHHDIEPMPNGNILLISYQYHSYSDAKLNGRNPDNLNPNGGMWCDKIVEIKPTGFNTGETVWQWSSWDHLIQDFDSTKLNFGIVKNHPGLININAGRKFGGVVAEDWQHVNSVKYNSTYDQILISSRQLSEIYIIDHSTTIAQAASNTGGKYGKGGDFLYRWGNNASYKRGNTDDQTLFVQHNAYWIPQGYPNEGKVMIFNNQRKNYGLTYSSIDIITLPYDNFGNLIPKPDSTFGPDTLNWSYNDKNNFYSNVMANGQMLRSGHVLVNEGQTGRMFEIDENKNVIWQFINPVGKNNTIYAQGQNPVNNYVYKAEIIYPDHPGLVGRTLIPGESVERNPLPLPSVCNNITGINFTDKPNISIFPNPFTNAISLSINKNLPNALIEIFDVFGRNVFEEQKNLFPSETYKIKLDLTNGIYFINIIDLSTNKIIIKTKLIKT